MLVVRLLIILLVMRLSFFCRSPQLFALANVIAKNDMMSTQFANFFFSV